MQDQQSKSSVASEAFESMVVSVEDSSRNYDQQKKLKPKIRQVNDFIVYHDEIIGQDGLGTIVKAQLASDLIDTRNDPASKIQVKP